MSDTDPIAYSALPNGAKVLSSSGNEIGIVEHVLQDSALDLFDGLVVKTSEGLRFVDARQVGTITAAAVQTTITDDQVASLPRPTGNEVLAADPDEYQGNGLSAWFGRMFLREHWKQDDKRDE
ncbi:MAG: hypothetical protein JWQ39_2 [Glaciihabitans sp.]|nr:hypothetical protein [Glaciihabitans sp.]